MSVRVSRFTALFSSLKSFVIVVFLPLEEPIVAQQLLEGRGHVIVDADGGVERMSPRLHKLVRVILPVVNVSVDQPRSVFALVPLRKRIVAQHDLPPALILQKQHLINAVEIRHCSVVVQEIAVVIADDQMLVAAHFPEVLLSGRRVAESEVADNVYVVVALDAGVPALNDCPVHLDFVRERPVVEPDHISVTKM